MDKRESKWQVDYVYWLNWITENSHFTTKRLSYSEWNLLHTISWNNFRWKSECWHATLSWWHTVYVFRIWTVFHVARHHTFDITSVSSTVKRASWTVCSPVQKAQGKGTRDKIHQPFLLMYTTERKCKRWLMFCRSLNGSSLRTEFDLLWPQNRTSNFKKITYAKILRQII